MIPTVDLTVLLHLNERAYQVARLEYHYSSDYQACSVGLSGERKILLVGGRQAGRIWQSYTSYSVLQLSLLLTVEVPI
jgi:hypothetical protein